MLIFDDEMGERVRESRRIRLQNLNEPLRRFEKVMLTDDQAFIVRYRAEIHTDQSRTLRL